MPNETFQPSGDPVSATLFVSHAGLEEPRLLLLLPLLFLFLLARWLRLSRLVRACGPVYAYAPSTFDRTPFSSSSFASPFFNCTLLRLAQLVISLVRFSRERIILAREPRSQRCPDSSFSLLRPLPTRQLIDSRDPLEEGLSLAFTSTYPATRSIASRSNKVSVHTNTAYRA